MIYRKKPQTVEARQFTYSTAFEVAHWCGGRISVETLGADPRLLLHVDGRTAELGDYVFFELSRLMYTTVPGERFEAEYEVADDDSWD